jgi:hypothetical protein
MSSYWVEPITHKRERQIYAALTAPALALALTPDLTQTLEVEVGPDMAVILWLLLYNHSLSILHIIPGKLQNKSINSNVFHDNKKFQQIQYVSPLEEKMPRTTHYTLHFHRAKSIASVTGTNPYDIEQFRIIKQ